MNLQARPVTPSCGTLNSSITGSKNVNRNIRMALIGRFARKDANDIRFENLR